MACFTNVVYISDKEFEFELIFYINKKLFKNKLSLSLMNIRHNFQKFIRIANYLVQQGLPQSHHSELKWKNIAINSTFSDFSSLCSLIFTYIHVWVWVQLFLLLHAPDTILWHLDSNLWRYRIQITWYVYLSFAVLPVFKFLKVAIIVFICETENIP